MVVAVTANDPRIAVVVPVVVAIVIAFPGPGDHAARAEQGEAQKNAADYGSFCVVHGVS
jgi:hypothetical protein